MDSYQKPTKEECAMYPIIKKYLEKDRWEVVITANNKEKKGPFRIWVGNRSLDVDIAAFRWGDDKNIDDLAIECKDGDGWNNVCDALSPQAISYQVPFTKVFISTKAKDLEHLDAILDQLKIGYLRVRNKKVSKIKDASNGINFENANYNSQVRNWGKLILAFQEALGDFEFGQDNKRDSGLTIYVNTPSKKGGGDLQYVAWGKEKNCRFAVFVESKPSVRHIAEKVDPSELFNLLKELPEEYQFEIDQKIHKNSNYEKDFGDSFEASIKELKEKDVKECITKLKKWTKCLAGPVAKFGGQMEIDKIIWKDWDTLSRKEAIKEIKNAKKELSSLYTYLSEL